MPQAVRRTLSGQVLNGMKIDIATKNITLDSALETFIEDKIGSLEKYLGPGPASGRVEIGIPSRRHKSGPIFYAEANITVDGKLLRAEASHRDLRSAIVKVKDDLKIEITKFKEKKKDLSRKPKK